MNEFENGFPADLETNSPSELRLDPVSRQWIICQTSSLPLPMRLRYYRTDFLDNSEDQDGPANCPYCPGNERLTNPEVLAFRHPGHQHGLSDWWVRVLSTENHFLTFSSPLERRADGIYDCMGGFGAHEIIVETTEHGFDPFRGPIWGIREALFAYQQRISFFKQHREVKYASFVRAIGQHAGQEVNHAHGHVFAAPVFSRKINRELNSARDHYARRERCLFCDIIEQEREMGRRIIFENEHFLGFVPFAARFPFELILIPLRHNPHFEMLLPPDIEELSKAINRVVGLFCHVLSNPNYLFVLHNGPNPDSRKMPDSWKTLAYDYHWYCEISPVLTSIAGFEVGTGLYRNPVPPEEAAALLREGKPIRGIQSDITSFGPQLLNVGCDKGV